MGFDISKDKEILNLKVGNLNIFVKSYNEGEPKLQIGPREIEKEGRLIYGKPGRISKEEFEFLVENKDEILKNMEKWYEPPNYHQPSWHRFL